MRGREPLLMAPACTRLSSKITASQDSSQLNEFDQNEVAAG